MGIQNFNKWIKETYPSCLLKPTTKRLYDYIYIDVNHILHNSIHECKKEKDFIKKLYYYLDFVFNNYIATKGVVLAVDGPSPYSKIILQRKRRRQGVNSKNTKSANNASNISSLCLTPGTELMYNLENHLQNYINKLKLKYKFINVNFILSPTTEPDEGELKIFSKLIEYGEKDIYATHLVIGNDADLVVLAMAAKSIYNINMLIRHGGDSLVISMKKLIIEYAKRSYNYINKFELDKELFFNIYNLRNLSIRDDFVIISIMMGNDYLPKTKFIKFENVWDAYYKTHQHVMDLNQSLMCDGLFNTTFFKKFLSILIQKIPIQFRTLNLKNYDEDLICNYLEGLLWCLNMYNTGKCKKYDYIYEYISGPSPTELLFWLESNDKTIKIPESNVPPLSVEACSILLIPKTGIKLLPKKYQKLSQTRLNSLYKQDECVPCNDLRGQLSIHHKALRQAQREGRDTTNIRKNISQVSVAYNNHKKNHTDDFTVNDIHHVVKYTNDNNSEDCEYSEDSEDSEYSEYSDSDEEI